jgi:hypothetical protein
VAQKIRAIREIRGVKIGKIFLQFSIKNVDTSKQKSNFLKIS